ncbi:hypothetical protein [Sporomusa aerivorans]|uniref:hypothetical protein n=1 Tax=Sporomusa aerivorans TaxID=204936 RepID=UPI003529E076
MKHISHRKNARRKYKRLVAALAGAAVVTSAMLPGLPISKAHAAENTVTAIPAAAETASKPLPPAVETPPVKNTTAETPADPTPATPKPDTEQNRQNTQERKPDRPKEERPNTVGSPVAAVKAAAAAYGFDARHDSFSLQSQSETEAVVLVRNDSGETYKVRLSKDKDTWRIDSVKEVITGGSGGVIRSGDPVDVVKANAGTFGFDAANDRFSLLSVAADKAIVQVKTSGQTFKVDLERKGGKWVITTIRGIGNGQYPATYRPASMYGYPTLGASTGPVVVTNERTIYRNDSFKNWAWLEPTYPADMKMGILLFKPDPANPIDIPNIIVEKVDAIDFGRQLALYAHIGSVTEQGYGIGIEKVTQAGNDLTVTIRTKSPLANHRWSSTQTSDVIPIDRLSLNFADPIHIYFVDQNGTALSTYTIHNR